MKQPKVSIMTLNWNGLKDTIECLESLKKIIYSNYEVVVIDNGSKENEAQVLEDKFGDYIRVIKNDRNYGGSGGYNIGMRYVLANSDADYLLMLDNDTVVDPEFLDEMVKVITKDSKVGVVTAVIYSYDKPDQIQQSLSGRINYWIGDLIGMDWFTALFVKPKLKSGLPREVKQTGFWCALFSRECIETIGLLDETYFFAWEGADYCERIGIAGYKIVYAPKAKIWHKWRTSQKMDGWIQYYHPRNRFKFMRQYATRMQSISFYVFFFAVHLWLATAYYLIWHRRPRVLLNFYKGVMDGVFPTKESSMWGEISGGQMRIKLLKKLFSPFRFMFGKGFGNVQLLTMAYRIFIGLLIPKQYTIVEVNDCQLGMIVGGDRGFDSLASGLIFGRGYEIETTELFKYFVKQDMIVVDVGAHIGYYTILASKLVGNDGQVWAFEPEPRNLVDLESNIELNKCSNIRAVSKAVSDKNGNAKLYVTANALGECGLIEVKHRPKTTIDVETLTLDSIIGDVLVDVIKIDVEGGEMGVLLGAEKLISMNHGIKIFIELWKTGIEASGYSCIDCWNILKWYGFPYIYLIDERNQKVERTDFDNLLAFIGKAGGVNLFCSKEEIPIWNL